MKFIYFLAASILIFVSCEKEDTTDQNNNNNNNTPSFSWKIDGDNYTDNSPVIDVNSSNVLTIDASDNSVDVRLIIYDFYSVCVCVLGVLGIPSVLLNILFEGVVFIFDFGVPNKTLPRIIRGLIKSSLMLYELLSDVYGTE